MIEFKSGIYKTLKYIIGNSSLARAVIYTLGHIIIAMVCNNLITGAPFRLAALDALIEPIVNGVWYYLLDKLWSTRLKIYRTK